MWPGIMADIQKQVVRVAGIRWNNNETFWGEALFVNCCHKSLEQDKCEGNRLTVSTIVLASSYPAVYSCS